MTRPFVKASKDCSEGFRNPGPSVYICRGGPRLGVILRVNHVAKSDCGRRDQNSSWVWTLQPASHSKHPRKDRPGQRRSGGSAPLVMTCRHMLPPRLVPQVGTGSSHNDATPPNDNSIVHHRCPNKACRRLQRSSQLAVQIRFLPLQVRPVSLCIRLAVPYISLACVKRRHSDLLNGIAGSDGRMYHGRDHRR